MVFPISCLRASNETRNVFIFEGPPPIKGVVHVVQNDPIRVGALDASGQWRTQERDCGTFVLITRAYWLRLKALSRAKETPPTPTDAPAED